MSMDKSLKVRKFPKRVRGVKIRPNQSHREEEEEVAERKRNEESFQRMVDLWNCDIMVDGSLFCAWQANLVRRFYH